MTTSEPTTPLSISECLDRLDALLASGVSVFAPGKRAARDAEIRRLLAHLREVLTQHTRRAGDLQAEAEGVLRRAQDEARRIVLEAEEHARGEVDDQVARAAEHQIKELREQAARDADEVRRGADAYALGVLERLEAEVSRILSTVRRGKTILGERTAGRGGSARPVADSRAGRTGGSRADDGRADDGLAAAASRLDNEKMASV